MTRLTSSSKEIKIQTRGTAQLMWMLEAAETKVEEVVEEAVASHSNNGGKGGKELQEGKKGWIDVST
jgi:hypothetical protein